MITLTITDGSEDPLNEFDTEGVDERDVLFLVPSEAGCSLSRMTHVARNAKALGAFMIGVVDLASPGTDPQSCDRPGPIHDELRAVVDALLVVPRRPGRASTDGSDRDSRTGVADAADITQAVATAVTALSDFLGECNVICAGMEDVRVLLGGGTLLRVGLGTASGSDGTRDATRRALYAAHAGWQLSEIAGALLVVTMPPDGTVEQAYDGYELAAEMLHEDSPLVMGLVPDENAMDEVRATMLIAVRT